MILRGWLKKSWMVSTKSLIRKYSSQLNYAGAGWQPYICESNIRKIERLQNQALRPITAQLVSTAIEALYIEAGVPSHTTTSKRLVARSLEKFLRRPEDHPRRITADERADRRTDRNCWRSVAYELLGQLPAELNNREQLDFYPLPLWQQSSCKLQSYPIVPGIKGRSGYPTLKRAMNLAQIRSLSADLTIYTDGTATAGLEDGGNSGIVTSGQPEELNIIGILKAPGRKFTSSYLEEKAALEKVLAWLLENGDDPNRVALICTDS